MMRCQWIVHRWFANLAVKYLEGSELIHGWSQWSEPSLQWARQNAVPTVLERSSAHILEQSKLLRAEYSRLGLNWAETHPRIDEDEERLRRRRDGERPGEAGEEAAWPWGGRRGGKVRGQEAVGGASAKQTRDRMARPLNSKA